MSKTIFLFLLVVLASVTFRLTNLDLIEFKADEAINLFLATRALFGHPFPPGSTVSSVGILNPPLLNYLLFPIAVISRDPRWVSFFIGLVNSAAIGFFFLISKRYYGLLTSFIASIFLAFSPWSILFSRKIWAQDLIFPLMVGLFFCLHQLVVKGKIYWTLYVFISLLLLQLHQSTAFFLIPLTLFLLVKKPKINKAFIVLGVLLGLLPTIPSFYYLARHLGDTSMFMVAKERLANTSSFLLFFRPLQILSQGNFHFVLGEDIGYLATKFPLVYMFRKLLYLEYVFLPLGIVIFWKKFKNVRFLVYSVIVLPIVYYFVHIEPFMHYFIILLPFLALYLASFFTFLLERSLPLKILSISLFALLITASVSFDFAFATILQEKKSLKGDYGQSFILVEQEVKEKLGKYKDDPKYEEMILASFVPKNLIYGNLPVGKMLYPNNLTQERLPLLEQRLREAPDDPLAQNELVSFYTVSKPTSEMLKFLKKKSLKSAGYEAIYDEVSRASRENSY